MADKAAAFRVPSQIIFGSGAIETVGAEAKRLGGTHAFVLSDPNLQKLGLADRIVASLSAQGIPSTVSTAVEFEPSVQSLAPAVAEAKATCPHCGRPRKTCEESPCEQADLEQRQRLLGELVLTGEAAR